MSEVFSLDASNEKKNFVGTGMQHKYRETLLCYVSQECHDICPWCFRKRLFQNQSVSPYEQVIDVDETLEYLYEHDQIQSVLLTGGDSMLADPDMMAKLLEGISRADHVKNVRFGTRALVLAPKKYESLIPRVFNKRVYVVVQAVRPEEITDELIDVRRSFPDHTFLVQTPLLKGINGDPDVLAALWSRLAVANMLPYYVFQNRIVVGNEDYSLSFEEGFRVFSRAQARTTGVMKTARFVMSNNIGKWEIAGIEGDQALLRSHQCMDASRVGEVVRVPKSDCWWTAPMAVMIRGDEPLFSSMADMPREEEDMDEAAGSLA